MAAVKGMKRGVRRKRAHQHVFREHNGFSPDWKTKREIIHHSDGDHFNNDPSNLEVMTQADHIRLHKPNLGRKYSEKHRRKLSEARKGNQNAKSHKHSEEIKELIGKRSKEWWDSEAGQALKTKRKNCPRKHSQESKDKMAKLKREWWAARREQSKHEKEQ